MTVAELGREPLTLFVDVAKYRGWTRAQVSADVESALEVIRASVAPALDLTISGAALQRTVTQIVEAANTAYGELRTLTPVSGIPQPWIGDTL